MLAPAAQAKPGFRQRVVSLEGREGVKTVHHGLNVRESNRSSWLKLENFLSVNVERAEPYYSVTRIRQIRNACF